MPNPVAAQVVCAPTNNGSLPTSTAAALTVLAPTGEELEELAPAEGEVTESTPGKRKRGGRRAGTQSRKPTQSELRRKMTDEDLFVLFCDHLDAISQIPKCKKLPGGGHSGEGV